MRTHYKIGTGLGAIIACAVVLTGDRNVFALVSAGGAALFAVLAVALSYRQPRLP